MLKNARPQPRDTLLPKAFRPAPVELRGATPKPAVTRESRALSWLRPIAVGGVLVASLAWTLASPGRAAQVAGATARVQEAFAVGLEGARTEWDRHLRAGAVVDAHAALQAEHRRLRIEVQRLRAVEREHARLADLLRVAEAHALVGVGARVVARGGGGRRTLRLDAGVERGLRPGLAVLGPEGVVGQLVTVGEGWSDVLAVTDPLHGSAARLAETGVVGTVRGTSDGLAMDHVLARYPVVPGEQVLTTGEGGVFPPGLPLGHVVEVAPDLGGPFLAIRVAPAAPPELLSEVYVVTGQAAPELAAAP